MKHVAMDQNDSVLPPQPALPPAWGRPPEASGWQKLKKLFAPIGVALALIAKFFAKLKFLILPVLKFLPVFLKTGGTMLLTIWIYGMVWGIWFAVGFVLLIFIHESGHLVAARRVGLKVGAPVFIPFMGALIALREAPRNAWIEAQVGIAGPLFGTLGALMCQGIYMLGGSPLFRALAYTGFFLNLFNLAPVGFLDGGRVATALSPWLWVLGFCIVGLLAYLHPNFLLILILLASLPRLFFLFRRKTDEERRYYEVTPGQRWGMAALYFGLVWLLVLGMYVTHIPRETLQN